MRSIANSFTNVSFVLALLAIPGRAQCLQWSDRFAAPGLSGFVHASVVHEDGSGESLFVGGEFLLAGGVAVDRVARWNGSAWSSLGTGMDASVRALAVFDDGSGPALFAGGEFTNAGGSSANRIAKWDGSSWSALGTGANAPVRALATFDDGSGLALYAGGDFTSIGGVSANRVAKWNGSSWSALDTGAGGVVRALCVFDDGAGDALFAGGDFTTAGGSSANRVAKWDGATWSALGVGTSAAVRALAVWDDGSGDALYAGGEFTSAGGSSANRIAKWDGTSWSALDTGLTGAGGFMSALAITSFDDGSGSALYAGGSFTTAGGNAASCVARWDGTAWSAVGGGTGLAASSPWVRTFAAFDAGSGPELYAGGDFTRAGTDVAAIHVAKWNGSAWSALPDGALGISTYGAAGVGSLVADPQGSVLYVGGAFEAVGTILASNVARFDGTSWSPLGTGTNGSVNALVFVDDGSGPALYAGGSFTIAGGSMANHVAKWDGTNWTALGDGTNDAVYVLAAFDDGSGTALYAGGSFTTAGAGYANRIAKWDGTSWSALGAGVDAPVCFVLALAGFDDGSGPALYVGGEFWTAGGGRADHVAKWGGSSWSALGTGLNQTVNALAIFDDGSGPAVYAGGDFTSYGMVSSVHCAKWDGSTWSQVGGGVGLAMDWVSELTVFDDGSGAALYAGGNFANAGGNAARNIAKWDGSSWTGLDAGLGTNATGVGALAVFDDGADGAPDLYAGGNFTIADSAGGGGTDIPSSLIAQWHGCEPGTAYCFGDGIDSVVTAQCPCSNFGDAGHGCANSNSALGGARLFASGSTNPNTIVFTCSGVPNNNLCTFLRGTLDAPGGAVFGDGVKCASGTVLRFGQQTAGQGGNPSNTVITPAASVASGNTRYYQCHYRNPNAGFCPPALFNVSNGYAVAW